MGCTYEIEPGVWSWWDEAGLESGRLHPSQEEASADAQRYAAFVLGGYKMKLWLDDERQPWKHGCLGWTWAKTAAEAIELLKTGNVEEASLDHDLAWEHYPAAEVDEKDYKEQTGYSVVCWMEENNVWPPNGTRVHSMNPVGREKMQKVIDKAYKNV